MNHPVCDPSCQYSPLPPHHPSTPLPLVLVMCMLHHVYVKSVYAPQCLCSSVSMFHHANVSLHQCSTISIFRLVFESVYSCFNMSALGHVYGSPVDVPQCLFPTSSMFCFAYVPPCSCFTVCVFHHVCVPSSLCPVFFHACVSPRLGSIVSIFSMSMFHRVDVHHVYVPSCRCTPCLCSIVSMYTMSMVHRVDVHHVYVPS